MRRHTLIIVVLTGIILILNNLPILTFSLLRREGMIYMGRREINSQDMYTYVASIEQSKQGRYLFRNLFTSEPHQASLFRPSYLLIGKSAALLQVESVLMYHLARIVLSIVFCIILARFLTHIFYSPTHRLIAYALILTSSGIGWLIGYIVPESIDRWIPEANTFLMLAEAPHFILSQILLLSGYLSFLQYLKTRNWRALLVLGVCFGLLSFEHPFDLLVVAPVLFGTSLLSGTSVFTALLITGLSSVWIGYPLMMLRNNPLFAIEQSQGASISPAPLQFLTGYGALVPLAMIGMERKYLEKKPVFTLLFLWIASTTLAIYAPVSFQRRLSEGLHLPLTLFASISVIAFSEYVRKFKSSLSPLFIILTLVFLSLSSWRAIAQDFIKISQDSPTSYYFSLLQEEIDAMRWLRDHATADDVILSNWFYGNYLAGITGKTVYIGHKAQTAYMDQKIGRVNSFLIEKDNSISVQFLLQERISLIYVKDTDTLVRYGFTPDERPYLTKIYDVKGVRIYRVNQATIQTHTQFTKEEKKP